MKKTYVLATAVVLLLVGAWLATSSKDRGQEIVFGFVAPLTGDIAAYGETERFATQMAVDEINAKGGIKGKSVRVVYEDGKCDGKTAATVAEKLVNVDKVKIILGGLCSSETLAMAPIIEQNDIILFSVLSSSPDISRTGYYVFRNGPSDVIGGSDLAQYVKKRHQSVAIISENTPFALGLRSSFSAEFISDNTKTIILDEGYPTDTSEFRSIFTKLKDKKFDALVLFPQGPESGLKLLRAYRELGFTQPLFGNLAFEAPEVVKNVPELVEGLIFPNAPILDESRGENGALLEKYKRYSGGKAPALTYDFGARYDSVQLLAETIEKVGFNSDDIAKHLYNLKEYCGAIGCYHFDENGDVVGVPYILFEIKNGKSIKVLP